MQALLLAAYTGCVITGCVIHTRAVSAIVYTWGHRVHLGAKQCDSIAAYRQVQTHYRNKCTQPAPHQTIKILLSDCVLPSNPIQTGLPCLLCLQITAIQLTHQQNVSSWTMRSEKSRPKHFIEQPIIEHPMEERQMDPWRAR
jgi:hypothetical protein